MNDEKYNKLYTQWRRDLLKHEEHKMALFDQIEKLQLKLWKYDEESHKREMYLVEKIERLEEDLRRAKCKV